MSRHGVREFRFSMDDPRFMNSQTITETVRRKFQSEGLDMHMNDVLELIDDHDRRERVLKVKTPRAYSIPGCSPGGRSKKTFAPDDTRR